jgi:hypothetical protein
MAKARAVVQVGDKQFELQQFDLPRIGSDDALMRVEVCGILSALERALMTLAGRVTGEHAVSVSLNPWL